MTTAPLLRPLLKMVANYVSALQQIVSLEDIQNRVCRGARERISSECSTQTARSRTVHNFGAAGDRCERQSATERFGSHNQVRFNAVMLAGEHLSRAPKAGLHFVGDKQDAVLMADIHHDAEKLGRRRDEASFTENRFS